LYGKNFTKCYSYDGFIILVNESFDRVIPLVTKLKKMNKKVFIGYHESMHLSDNMTNIASYKLLKQLVGLSDGYWNLNEGTHTFFESLFDCRVVGIPTGVPYDLWEPGVDEVQKEGIIIGTRTLSQTRLKRNSLMAISLAVKCAKKYNTAVTYMSEDKNDSANHFLCEMFGDSLNIIARDRNASYFNWLELINKHKALFQFDSSRSHGQVISDAVLVNTIPIGGTCDNSKILGLNEDGVDDAYELLSLFFERRLVYDLSLLRNKISFKNTKEGIQNIFEE
jgi:hypothetical protein